MNAPTPDRAPQPDRDWFNIDNADQIASPALLVYPDRIQQNLETMIAWGGAEKLRPHVKTHKMPNVIRMKLDAGITRFKSSTIAESEMVAQAGGPDVLLAYQPVGPNIPRLLDLIRRFPDTHFSTVVDDAATAKQLDQAAIKAGICVDVFIDLNIGMNRTGISPDEQAIELYRQVRESTGLRAAGIHAYDGHIHDTDEAVVHQRCEQAFASAWDIRTRLLDLGWEVPSVVGCGSTSSKLMAQRDGIEVSAGTSVLWDAGQDNLSPAMGLKNAAVLLTRVISRPTNETLCIDLGHKAVAAEMPAPRVRFFELPEAEAVMHSEEHLVLKTQRASEFDVGSVLYGLPTHICPTVALYDRAWCVRDHRAIEQWDVLARRRFISI